MFAHTTSVVWAETPDGDVIAIHNSETEQFPFSCVTDQDLDTYLIGDQVNVNVCHQLVDPLQTQFEICPTPDAVDPDFVISTVVESDDPRLLVLTERLSAGLNGRGAAFDDTVLWLLGRGEGLTPMGDDVLLGVLAAEEAFAAGWDIKHRVGQVLDQVELRTVTTRASVALLNSALARRYPPSLVSLVAAFSRPCDLTEAILRVRAIGNTSGPAILAGISVLARHALTSSQN
ncbi:MAG TPA: hypothetical protein DF783_00845 [Acidimicrobiaceae bacterium]|nr:hypothetical protein [Acidimicrobiaceae bacterium]HJO79748.1 DUF2877 domain-containing protein [Acidimicrobiales bacterium]